MGKPAGRPRFKLTDEDKEFSRLIAEEGLGSIKAARKAYGWRCVNRADPDWEAAKAKRRVKAIIALIKELRDQANKEAQAESILSGASGGIIDEEALLRFAFVRLQALRENQSIPASSRFKAIEALQKLHDPSQDTNLIWTFIDVAQGGLEGHCPACHEDFPLTKVEMKALKEYRKESEIDEPEVIEDLLERRKYLINKAERRIRPHEGQINALGAKERHIIGLGAARAGKSFLLAMFSWLYFLIPGSESWLLARTFEDARTEKEYLQGFINTAFHPLAKHMISILYDSKSGETTITSRWGSELKIKSAISKGSITAREIDACLIAEPGWIQDDIYNQVRARISSRLGRIIALGTPQGMGGFISRLVFVTGRDPKTGKVRRLTAQDRLLSNGADWNISALVFDLTPQQNPAYVKSELDAARQEMGDEEYETEFEGKMVAYEGHKFYAIKQVHLQPVDKKIIGDCVFVLGIDQGPKNFGAVLLGFDGQTVYVLRDYFETSFKTIRTNMMTLMNEVPIWIRARTGVPGEWKLTIFDQDPPVHGTLQEMEEEGIIWPTDVTFRHDNKKMGGLSED